MLCSMALWLSGKVVALELDNSTANAYLCNQAGTVSFFFPDLPATSLANKHGIAVIPVYIPAHLNVEANYLSQEKLFPEWYLLPCMAQAAFLLWGQLEVDLLAYSHAYQCQLH